MPIYQGSTKIGDLVYNNQTISKGYYGSTLVYEKNQNKINVTTLERILALDTNIHNINPIQNWIVPNNVYEVDVFLVGAGSRGYGGGYGGGGGYTMTWRGSGYTGVNNQWQTDLLGGRNGNAIQVYPGQNIPVIVGINRYSSNSFFMYSMFMNENHIASNGGDGIQQIDTYTNEIYYDEGINGGSGGGSGNNSNGTSGGYGGSNGGNGTGLNNSGTGGTGQGHNTGDFGENTGLINAGGGGGTRLNSVGGAGGFSHYVEGKGKDYGTATGGGGYGGGGAGDSWGGGADNFGGDGTVLLRYNTALQTGNTYFDYNFNNKGVYNVFDNNKLNPIGDYIDYGYNSTFNSNVGIFQNGGEFFITLKNLSENILIKFQYLGNLYFDIYFNNSGYFEFNPNTTTNNIYSQISDIMIEIKKVNPSSYCINYYVDNKAIINKTINSTLINTIYMYHDGVGVGYINDLIITNLL